MGEVDEVVIDPCIAVKCVLFAIQKRPTYCSRHFLTPYFFDALESLRTHDSYLLTCLVFGFQSDFKHIHCQGHI